MKNWKSYILLLVGLVCLAVTSCRTYIDKLTPCPLTKKALAYTESEPNDFGWFHSLDDGERLLRGIISMRRDRLEEWNYWIRKDENAYNDAKGQQEPIVIETRETQERVIGSEDQPLSILGILSYLGIGSGALLLGKEKLVGKNQYTKEQHDVDVAIAKDEGRKEANHIT